MSDRGKWVPAQFAVIDHIFRTPVFLPINPKAWIQLGRDRLPNSDVRSFHAGHIAEDITKPRQHARSHGPRLTLSGGWSWLPENVGANSTFGRGLNDANRFLDRGLHISSVYILDFAGDNTVLCRYQSRLTTVRLVGRGIKASIGFQHMTSIRKNLCS